MVLERGDKLTETRDMGMAHIDTSQSIKTGPAGLVTTAINILTSPSEAFTELEQRPAKLFPLIIIMLPLLAVMFWYFTIIDFDWFIDDTLANSFPRANLFVEISEDGQLEQAREAMESMSQTTFRMIGVFGGAAGMLLLWVLQASYLSLVSQLNGDRFRFTHWFSLAVWTALPYLLTVIGMAVTISLNPNGQLSSFDLDPLTLTNLGITSSNNMVSLALNSVSLTQIWGVVLTVLAFKQWLVSGWIRALSIVLAPYLLIIGVSAYFLIS